MSEGHKYRSEITVTGTVTLTVRVGTGVQTVEVEGTEPWDGNFVWAEVSDGDVKYRRMFPMNALVFPEVVEALTQRAVAEAMKDWTNG